MKYALFFKGYERDKSWLDYALRSVEKFCQGFDEIVIVMPDGQHFTHQIARVVEIREQADCNHYLFQQSTKLHADAITEAEFITFSDSDTIFTRPVSPEMLFTDGKLNWMMSPYADVDTPWQSGASAFIGIPVAFEFMRRFPICVPRWLLTEVRAFCQNRHGMTLNEYVMAQEPPNPPFSEFNALGAYAYYFHPKQFNWIDTSQVPESEWPELVVLQSYSHDGLSEAKIAEFETILSGGISTAVSAEQPLQELTQDRVERPAPVECSTALPAQEFQTPWADRAASIAEIKRIGARLRAFQGNNPSKVRFVRILLQQEGVIVLPYRRKKRKGWKRKKK